MFIGDVTQFAKVFFLIYILQNLKNFSHDFKMLKKKKKILNKTNKNCSQRNVKHSQVERNQPRGRPRFKENKFSIKEARKLLTPQRTLNSFLISYRLKQLKKITYTKKKTKQNQRIHHRASSTP